MEYLQKRRRLIGAVSSLCSAAVFASFAASSSPLIAQMKISSSPFELVTSQASLPLEDPARPETGDVALAFTSSFDSQAFSLFVRGMAYPHETMYIGGEEYVAAADFSEFAGIDGKIGAETGKRYFTVNGRCRPAFSGVVLSERGAAVPLSSLCGAAGLEYEVKDGCVFVSGEASAAPGDEYYNEEDLYWLSRIIRAESETESLEGKIAVGNVVLNRVRSDSFPGDVKGVVFDRRYGVAQFSPASTDAIYVTPDEESVAAAKICLEGYSLSDEIIYFMNPALATSSWISDNRPAVMTIGNHTFYS